MENDLQKLSARVAEATEYAHAFPENVDTIREMKTGCAHQRALTLLTDEQHEKRAIVLQFLKMERPGLFSPRI